MPRLDRGGRLFAWPVQYLNPGNVVAQVNESSQLAGGSIAPALGLAAEHQSCNGLEISGSIALSTVRCSAAVSVALTTASSFQYWGIGCSCACASRACFAYLLAANCGSRPSRACCLHLLLVMRLAAAHSMHMALSAHWVCLARSTLCPAEAASLLIWPLLFGDGAAIQIIC